MSKCNDCVHKIPIVGNCHIGCNNLKALPFVIYWHGCGQYPLCFDEGIVKKCDEYSNNTKDKIERKNNPLEELARLLAG